MPRKPDRFERAATRAAYKLIWGKNHPDGGELQIVIAKELRKEHRWVERLVKDIAQDYESSVGDTAAEMLRDEILARLKQRRK